MIRMKIYRKECESESEHFWKKTFDAQKIFDARWCEWKYTKENENAKTKASISENDLIAEILKVEVLYR